MIQKSDKGSSVVIVNKADCLGQGWRSRSQNCGKKSKVHHFLVIVQHKCNTTMQHHFSLYKFNGEPKKQ